VESPLILVLIVLAFAVFGIALAYVDSIASRRPDEEPAE
jgi:hypothetical protein